MIKSGRPAPSVLANPPGPRWRHRDAGKALSLGVRAGATGDAAGRTAVDDFAGQMRPSSCRAYEEAVPAVRWQAAGHGLPPR